MYETCEGCGSLQREDWAKGKTAYRCMNREAGQRRGYVVEVEKAELTPALVRPAWCPKKHGK